MELRENPKNNKLKTKEELLKLVELKGKQCSRLAKKVNEYQKENVKLKLKIGHLNNIISKLSKKDYYE